MIGYEQYDNSGNKGIIISMRFLFIERALSRNIERSFSLDKTGKENLSTLNPIMLFGILDSLEAWKYRPDFPILSILVPIFKIIL